MTWNKIKDIKPPKDAGQILFKNKRGKCFVCEWDGFNWTFYKSDWSSGVQSASPLDLEYWMEIS